MFEKCFHLNRLFDVQFLLTEWSHWKCNYSSTLVIQGLLEAIAADDATTNVSDIFKKTQSKKQKKINK